MILLIDNYDSFTYNLYQLIGAMYPDVKVVRNDQLTLEEIKNLNPKAIIISPGPGRPEEAGICIDLIKAFYRDIPILGVCLGHQAIGIAFGGNVISASQILHGKASPIFHQRDGIFAKTPLPFLAGRYHSLMVEKKSLPKELAILAEDEQGQIMSLKHIHAPCYGMQFHPESILTSHGEGLIRAFIDKEVVRC